MEEEIVKKSEELEEEANEKSKKITSEDIHDGWDSKVNYHFVIVCIPTFSSIHQLNRLLSHLKRLKKRRRQRKRRQRSMRLPVTSVASTSTTSTTTTPALANDPAASSDSDEEPPEFTSLLREFSEIEISASVFRFHPSAPGGVC
jgi:cell division cycle protein 37